MEQIYLPNFNDPRIQKRIKKALGFACGVMSETKPQQWSTRYIDKYFGVSSHDLSKYLRKTLLIVYSDRWNKDTGECKSYLLNPLGVNFLKESLKLGNTQIYPIVSQVGSESHQEELVTGKFEYYDKSNRLWHPLQRYRRDYKKSILSLHGYQHQYDISSCAVQLIHQHAQHLGMDEYLFAIRKYINDKEEIRKSLANECEITPKQIKELINALLAGASISLNKETDIYKMLNGDVALIEFLKQHEFLSQLRSDMKICWNNIKETIPRRRNISTNRLLPVSCKQKWIVYFELERQVLNSVKEYLDMNSVRYFLEHDGWSCDREINQNELCEFIKNRTGFDLKLEYEFVKSDRSEKNNEN
jgi:hypothetical protein